MKRLCIPLLLVLLFSCKEAMEKSATTDIAGKAEKVEKTAKERKAALTAKGF